MSEENPDPLDELEAIDRRTCVRQAWTLAVAFPVATVLLWIVLDQTVGDGTVTRVLPILVALAGPVATAVVVLRKWRHYRWWQPFMGTLWWLIPVFLLTATTLLPPLITGH